MGGGLPFESRRQWRGGRPQNGQPLLTWGGLDDSDSTCALICATERLAASLFPPRAWGCCAQER